MITNWFLCNYPISKFGVDRNVVHCIFVCTLNKQQFRCISIFLKSICCVVSTPYYVILFQTKFIKVLIPSPASVISNARLTLWIHLPIHKLRFRHVLYCSSATSSYSGQQQSWPDVVVSCTPYIVCERFSLTSWQVRFLQAYLLVVLQWLENWTWWESWIYLVLSNRCNLSSYIERYIFA